MIDCQEHICTAPNKDRYPATNAQAHATSAPDYINVQIHLLLFNFYQAELLQTLAYLLVKSAQHHNMVVATGAL